jgi:mannose-6-phosphate isomerase-like protein (cupin superfamily)
MKKVNIDEKLSSFSDHWNPRVIGELNGQQVKAVKLKGEFVWHHHDHEDELFLVIKGTLRRIYHCTERRRAQTGGKRRSSYPFI